MNSFRDTNSPRDKLFNKFVSFVKKKDKKYNDIFNSWFKNKKVSNISKLKSIYNRYLIGFSIFKFSKIMQSKTKAKKETYQNLPTIKNAFKGSSKKKTHLTYHYKKVNKQNKILKNSIY